MTCSGGSANLALEQIRQSCFIKRQLNQTHQASDSESDALLASFGVVELLAAELSPSELPVRLSVIDLYNS